MKIEDFFGRKLFLPHCTVAGFLLLIKLKCHSHFDRPKEIFNPKIEKIHSYAPRFAVSLSGSATPFYVIIFLIFFLNFTIF
jgi:hypothetical protein